MASFVVEKDIAAPAAVVWDIVEDFGAIDWIPPAGKVDVKGSGPGMQRHIHGSGDGPPVVEELTSCDPGARVLRYAIVENNPLPVTRYEGTITVADGPEGTALTWTAEFDPAGDEAEAVAVVELMLGALSGWLADAATAR